MRSYPSDVAALKGQPASGRRSLGFNMLTSLDGGMKVW